MSICGRGMLTRSRPFLPIISPRLMYLLRLLFTLPRTILRNRWWSRSIFWLTAGSPGSSRVATRGLGRHYAPGLLLGVPAREDARHEAEHVRRAHVAVAVGASQPTLDHVDLLLRRLVHHAGDQAG